MLGNEVVTAVNPVANITTSNAMFSPECNVFNQSGEHVKQVSLTFLRQDTPLCNSGDTVEIGCQIGARQGTKIIAIDYETLAARRWSTMSRQIGDNNIWS